MPATNRRWSIRTLARMFNRRVWHYLSGGTRTLPVWPTARVSVEPLEGRLLPAVQVTLFDTGVDATGAALADDQPDPHYQLVSPGGTGLMPGPVRTISSDGFPIGPWAGNLATSRWVVPAASDSDGNGASGTYDYRTTFDLSGLDPDSVVISGQWAADDAAAVYLNGVSTGVTLSAPGFGSLTAFSLADGFRPGVNVLDFVVENGGGPTGLRVTGLTGVGEPGLVAAVPAAVFNTGVDASGAPLPDAAAPAATGLYSTGAGLADLDADPHFAVTDAPSGYVGGTKVRTAAGGYPIGPWAGDTAGSAWVVPAAADAQGNAPPGTYAYSTTVTVTDPASLVLSGKWAADDEARIFVNGSDTGVTLAGFGGLVPFTLSGSYLVAGANTVEFRVTNAGISPNPTGLRVEWDPVAPAIDPHWVVVSAPDSALVGPAKVVPGAAYPFPLWLANDDNSRWVAPLATAADGSGPVGTYVFQTTFDLTGYDPETAALSGRWSADNRGVEVYLNGVPLGLTVTGPDPGTGVEAYRSYADLYIAHGIGGATFLPGTNTLTFVVHNDPVAEGSTAPTPVGLRVDDLHLSAAPTGAIGDTVFHDTNGDGVQNPGETGAAGVTVTLTGGPLLAPRTATTDGSGHYTFSAVAPGAYTVTFAVPNGYALSTPAGGAVELDLSIGEVDSTADAGLVAVPVVGGRAVVAARGYEFDGPVALVTGTGWTAENLDATIEWGDGSWSAGTLVAMGGTLQVVGQHTYTYEGAYALAVRVSPDAAPAFADFAGGLAYVLSTTDHRGPQAVSSVTVTGGGSLGDNGGPGGLGFTASAAAAVGYTLTESGEEPGGSFTLTRSGTLAFSLWESGGDFAQPDSGLTLTVTEAATRTRADAAPLAWGTSSDSVDATYTLTQTGIGADYTWNRTGTERGTVRQTLTVADGTLTAAQTRTASLTGSGTADFPAGTASQEWSGTDTRTRTEAGYHGPVAYGETRTEAGTVTGSESGGTADYAFVRNEGRAGTYSLSRSESYTGGGGTEAGTGRYADGLTATGNDATGDATATATQTADLTWTGAASLGGVPTTSAGTRSAAATDTVSGNAYAGPFVAGSRSGAGGVTTLTRVSQGVTFTQTVTANSANSSTLTGSLGAGGYTLTGGDAATATATARDVNGGVTHTATRTQTASAGYTRTGDRLTGAYSLHVTDSSSFTAAGGSSQTTALAAGSTSGRHTLAQRETASGSLAATVDQTGTLVTGAYSLHRTGTDTATEGRTQTDDSDAAGAGGATRAAHATTRADATATAYPTADRAGNALTGAYSLHETATSTATRFATSTADSSAREAGTTQTAYSGEWSTVSGSDATTADRTGSAVSGDYTITQVTSAGSGAVAATATGTVSVSASDGSYASSSRLGTSAAVFLSGATGTGTGNAVTGASTATRTAVAVSQATATVTARSTARSADQSDASAAEGSTSTTTRTDGATVTESADPAAGSYSLHQETTADATVRATGTASAYGTGADGATGDESRSATSQATSGGTGTFDRTWNADSGSYSLYQSSTDSGAATATAGYRATETAADGAYASASRTSTSTAAQYDSASEHRNGNDVLGDYTLSDAGTAASATVTSTDTTAGTQTAVSGAARSEAGTGTFTHRQYDTTARDQTGGELGGAYTLHRYASSSSTNVGASTATDSWVAADGSRGSDTATAGSTAREYATATVTQDGVSVTGEDSVHQASGASATTTAGGTASNSWVGADGAFASRTATSGATAYRYGNDARDATTALDSGYSLHQVTGGSATAIATDTASGFWQGATAESRQDTSTAGSTRYQYSTDTNDFTRNFTGGYAGTAVSAASATAISADTASSSWADLTGASRSDTATANSTAKTYLDGTLRTWGDASGTYSLLQTDSSSATVTGTSTASDAWAGADGATGADTLTRGATAYQYGTGTTRGNGYPTLGTVHTESGGSATFIESATGSASQSGADSSSRSDTLTAGSTVRQYADATTDATSASTGSYTLTATAHSSATATGTNTASAGWFGANGAFGADTVTHGTTAYRYATTTADENRTAADSYARTDTSVGSATLVSADTAWDAAYGPDGSTSTHAATADATDKSYARTTVSERGDATGTYSVRQTDSASATLTANSTAADTVVAADGARWQATATAGSAASRSVTATVTNNGLPGSDTLHRESTASATTVDTGTATSFGIDAAGTGRSDARSATTTAREYATAAADSTALAAGSYTLHTSETSSATVTGTSGSSYYWLDANLDSGRGTATAAPTLYQYFTGTGDYNRGATGSYTQSDASAASATALSADTAENTLTTYDGATRSDAVTADSDTRNYLTRTTNKRGEQRTGSYSLLETSNESSSVTAAGASSDAWVAADGGTGYGTATGGSTVHQYADATATQTGVPTSDTLHRVGSGSSYATGTNTASSTWEDRDGGFGSTTQTGLSIARQFAQGTADATAWSTGEYTLSETSEGSASAIGESTSSGTWHGADDSTGEGTATQNSLASQFYNGTGDYSRTADGAFGRTDTYSGSSTADVTGTASNTSVASDGATRTDTATAETSETGYSGGTITAQGNDTGTYSLRQTDTSGSTVTTANTASDAWAAADSAHGADTQTARSTAYQYGNTTLRENGDATSSTVHQDSPSSATVYASETGSASKVGSDGSTKNWTRTADSTARQNATDSVDVTGTSTGNYTLHATSVSSASVTGTTTTSDFWEGADGSVGSDTATGSSTRYQYGTGTRDYSTNASDSYTQTDRYVGSATLITGDAATEGWLEGSGRQGRRTQTAAATAQEYADNTLAQRADASGSYSLHQTDSPSTTATAAAGWTVTVQTPLSGGGSYTETAAGGQTSSVRQAGSTTVDNYGNSSLGDYTFSLTEAGGGTSTLVNRDPGLTTTAVVTETRDRTTAERGNTSTGTYSLFASSTTDRTAPVSGEDARGSFTGHDTAHAAATTREDGNRNTGRSTSTQVTSDTWDADRTGGASGDTYTQTRATSDDTTYTYFVNDGTGDRSWTGAEHHTARVDEHGAKPSYTTYSLRDESTHDLAASMALDADTGIYTLTRGETTTSKLTQTGGGSSSGNTYDLSKTATAYDDSTRVGDAASGEYALTGAAGETSTAVGTSTQESRGTTFTEVLSDDYALTEYGNDYTGDYELAEDGETTADFRSDGTARPYIDDPVSTVHVTETSEGTYDRTTTGNRQAGGYRVDETSETDHDFTQTVTGGTAAFTLSGGGTDTATATETGWDTTGEYTRHATGTDHYTLDQSGTTTAAFSDHVTGTDAYVEDVTGNHLTQAYDRTTTGGGAWSRTATGGTLTSGTGTNAYTHTEARDDLGGDYLSIVSGESRYQLLEVFHDLVSSSGSRGPGNVTFHSHGLPYRDPNGTTKSDSPAVAGEYGNYFSGVLPPRLAAKKDRIDRMWASLSHEQKQRLNEYLNSPDMLQHGNGYFEQIPGQTAYEKYWELQKSENAQKLAEAQMWRLDSTALAWEKRQTEQQQVLAQSEYAAKLKAYEDFIKSDFHTWQVILTGAGVKSAALAMAKGDAALYQLFGGRFSKEELAGKGELGEEIARDVAGAYDFAISQGLSETEASQYALYLNSPITSWHAAKAEAEEGVSIRPHDFGRKLTGDERNARLLEAGAGFASVVAAGMATSSDFKHAFGKVGKGQVPSVPSMVQKAKQAVYGDGAAAPKATPGGSATTKTPKRSFFSFSLDVLDQQACFVAGTRLLTPDGSKPIEQFQPGDLILSREETDPNGWIEPKAVEEVFVRAGRVMWLTVSGRRIGTTQEHPFYVLGIGWRCAGELKYGDVFASHNGTVGVVEAVDAVPEMVTVYNLRVADWHTYFVGSDEWGFSVWAHNAECAVLTKTDRDVFVLSKSGTNEVIKIGTEKEVLEFAADKYRINELRGFKTKTTLTPEAESKILNGALSEPGKYDMIGGHSPRLLTDIDYVVEVISENLDGTITVKYHKSLPGTTRGISNLKNPSTLAPKHWTDGQIIAAIKEVAEMQPYEYDLRGSSHVGMAGGIEWQVIKDRAGNITSAFPTGGKPPLKLTGK